MPSTSLILSSYNQPNALRLCFEGVLTQTCAIDEIVIGDDGSEDDTRALVESFATRTEIPVRYEWQEDRGFRKARALNNAIRASRGDVLLFLDGDCVPPPRWGELHLQALKGRTSFTTGGYVWMDVERARALTPEQVASGALTNLITEDERSEFRKIQRKERLYALLGKRKKPKILGGNWAVLREALYAVNGFDERFDGFTKEDSDVRNRLRNAGFRGRSLWGHNWVFHCSHDLDPRRNLPEVVRGEPDYSYYESRAQARRCELGLEQSE